MDLNEKLAHRRRQREQEAAIAKAKIDAELAKAKIDAELAKAKMEAELVKVKMDAELNDRPKDPSSHIGRESEKDSISNSLGAINDSDSEKKSREDAFSKTASDRWTPAENRNLGLLIIGIICGFFISWKYGLFLLIVTLVYSSSKSEKYRKEIEQEQGK